MNPIKQQIESFNENYKLLTDNCAWGGYNKVALFADYVWSVLRYGASAADYFEYEFYNKKHALKKQFVCYKYKTQFYHKLNDYSKASIFGDKVKFLQHFERYIKREWVDAKNCSYEEFEAFVKRHPEFIAKPQNLSCGKGVTRIDSFDDINRLYNRMKYEENLIEEIIIQHPAMSQLNSSSVNTVRVGTVMIGDEVKILGTALRCGVAGETIDNFCAGGILAKVDSETGIVISDGINVKHERFYRHPTSRIFFHGFQIPNWNKVTDLVRNASKEISGVGYIGWDVAIRADDAVLIEGNFEGMLSLFQVPTGEGIKAKVDGILDELDKH